MGAKQLPRGQRVDTVSILLFLVVMGLGWIATKLEAIAEEMRGARNAAEKLVNDQIARTSLD